MRPHYPYRLRFQLVKVFFFILAETQLPYWLCALFPIFKAILLCHNSLYTHIYMYTYTYIHMHVSMNFMICVTHTPLRMSFTWVKCYIKLMCEYAKICKALEYQKPHTSRIPLRKFQAFKKNIVIVYHRKWKHKRELQRKKSDHGQICKGFKKPWCISGLQDKWA